MRYLSVCSGIEAATVAWHPLGWEAAAFSEIEKFPRQVLAHHYPHVPLHGDFTTIKGNEYGPVELLVGGTPCQSFSIAGLRKGLSDPRGNLMLEYGSLAKRLGAKWLVWENVPGVLSANGGRDFGTFLGMLAELGYGFAYRVLDAQYFGVAQRRRRVFVVGCLGDWRSAAAVLFEQHSLQGHPAPSRKAREEAAGTLGARSGRSIGAQDAACGHMLPVAPTLDAHYGEKMGLDNQHINGGGDCSLPAIAMCLNAGGMGRQDAESETLIPTFGGGFDVAHTLRGEGFDASEDGTGRGTPLVAVPHVDTMPTLRAGAGNGGAGHGARSGDSKDEYIEPVSYGIRTANTSSNGWGIQEEATHTLDQAMGIAVAHPIAFGVGEQSEVGHFLRSGASKADKHESTTYVAQMPAHTFKVRGGCEGGGKGYLGQDDAAFTISTNQDQHLMTPQMQVRRLTPEECEALQGFPRGYTDIKPNGKPTADGPRYKALGNSMAVPVMSWIGQRIQAVEDIHAAQKMEIAA